MVSIFESSQQIFHSRNQPTWKIKWMNKQKTKHKRKRNTTEINDHNNHNWNHFNRCIWISFYLATTLQANSSRPNQIYILIIYTFEQMNKKKQAISLCAVTTHDNDSQSFNLQIQKLNLIWFKVKVKCIYDQIESHRIDWIYRWLSHCHTVSIYV